MRVIKLSHGRGNGVDTACLMTAANMLIGKGELLDSPGECICPILARFIVRTNDAMPVELLGELYGPLIWELSGTRSDDAEVKSRRVFAFADWAVREILPIVFPQDAERIRSLPEIACKSSADIAREAIRELRTAAYASAAAAYAAAHAAYAAAHAADYAAAAASAAAAAASAAAGYAAADGIWRKCPEILRRVIAIGDKRPVECVLTESQLASALNAQEADHDRLAPLVCCPIQRGSGAATDPADIDD